MVAPYNPDKFTPKDGAKFLQDQGYDINANWLRLKARQGKLPHVKIGSLYFFTLETLNNIIEVKDVIKPQDATDIIT